MPDFRLIVERDEICKECGGIGGSAEAVKQCDNCKGSGIQVISLKENLLFKVIAFKFFLRQTKVRQLGPGMLKQIRASCDKVSKFLLQYW